MNTSHSIQQEELAIIATHLLNRDNYSRYPESPKAYPEEAIASGEKDFQNMLNQNFPGLYEKDAISLLGEEVSPFLQVGLGIKYPQFKNQTLIDNGQTSLQVWKEISVAKRAEILIETLDAIKERFSELAYATMHTTGQSFLMSFQASGPHALDRALESIALGYNEISRFATQKEWVKNMGKFDLILHKNYKAIPKGVGLLIGCSTFPTWNTLPGMYANLITGNVVIAKPHPKAIYPMAIVISEVQKVLAKHNLPQTIAQLAVDTPSQPITKELCENTSINLIDYTGGNDFGNYVESLKGKAVFTEKAGINSVILDSSNDIQKTAQNIAFSISLYSGQMCTAPQNIYISETGINTPNGIVSFDEFCNHLAEAVKGLAQHPKAGPGTLAAIQNDHTLERVNIGKSKFSNIILDSFEFSNPEFENARVLTPVLVATNSEYKDQYLHEYFGPMAVLVKTKSFEESLSIAANSALEKGAITCLAYCTDNDKCNLIEKQMNAAYTPVSFNFSGAAFVNQHAAFSDFHVTGGNPAGNASFTDPNFVNNRFVWVGNRYMKE
jgi:phenylacetic acid degradation protein paaN